MILLEKLEQKRKYVILILIICLLVGLIYNIFLMPKKITSETTLMLIEKEEKSANEFTNKGNIELTKKMVSNFEEIIKSKSSINSLKDSLSLDINVNELANQINVKEVSNSDTFKLIVQNEDTDLAIKINNGLIRNFSEKIETIYSNTEVYIVDNTHIEENVNYLLFILIIILSTIIGIFINLIYLLILVKLDKRVEKSNDLESELALKNLGKIPLIKTKNKLIIENEKKSLLISFRNLRSNIQFINVNNKEKNTILVTSSRKSEGKTTIASNLAISFAETGKKVVLIDTNMNSGNIDKMFNLPNDLGLSNYLSGIDENGVEINERINKFIKDTTIKNLNIITSGTIPPNSSELLAMPKFEEMLKDLSVFYNIIILDGSQVLNATDALILARLANSTLIVSNYKKTKKDELWHTKRDIQNVGGRIIGIVINKVKLKDENTKIHSKTKLFLKENYLKLKDYIINKRESRKQKLLEAAIIEGKQKVSQELKAEENKLIEEIKKEESKDKKTIIGLVASKVRDVKRENTKDETEESLLSQVSNNTIIQKEPLENQKEVENKDSIEKNPVKESISNGEINSETLNNSTIKNKILNLGNSLKENSLKIISKVKKLSKDGIEKATRFVKKETEKVNEIKKQNEEKKVEKIKEEIAQEKIKESIEIIKENSEKTENTVIENFKIPVEENNILGNVIPEEKDANSVLVIVDAENGYCRAFSQYCFTEKLIRGIDKKDGFVKANYSSALVNKNKAILISKYNFSKDQVDRIDTLIYTVLKDYDECVRLERKMESNKAEEYLACMAKDYEKSSSETKENYELRCQYLRKVELAKCQIEIEYKLDNLWSSNQISFTDKVAFYNLAKKYDNLKERKKSKNISKENSFFKKYINLLKKIKLDEVKVKSVEELTKEVTNEYNQNDYENYQFEDYENYDNYASDEQLRIEEERKIKEEQLRIKQERKNQKAYENAQKREERKRKRNEQRKNRELKKQKAKEEARIEEELLVDNLYPKTKNNKNL